MPAAISEGSNGFPRVRMRAAHVVTIREDHEPHRALRLDSLGNGPNAGQLLLLICPPARELPAILDAVHHDPPKASLASCHPRSPPPSHNSIPGSMLLVPMGNRGNWF